MHIEQPAAGNEASHADEPPVVSLVLAGWVAVLKT